VDELMQEVLDALDQLHVDPDRTDEELKINLWILKLRARKARNVDISKERELVMALANIIKQRRSELGLSLQQVRRSCRPIQNTGLGIGRWQEQKPNVGNHRQSLRRHYKYQRQN